MPKPQQAQTRDYTIWLSKMKLIIGSALWLLAAMCSIANELTNYNKTQIVSRAKTLYMQRKPAHLELLAAAKTGDAEAQFYLAEDLRENFQYMTPEAKQWYEAAANQGDYYAIFRLANSENTICRLIGNCPEINAAFWKNAFFSKVKAAARRGNAEAMAVLYQATGNVRWLEKLAAAGFPSAQLKLAHQYREGHRFFWPGQRKNAINRLIEAAAQKGHPKAMLEYSGLLVQTRKFEEAWLWLERAAATGYADAVLEYALTLKDGMPAGLNKNVVSAHGLLNLLLALDGGGRLDDLARYVLHSLEPEMSAEQITCGKHFAEQWKSNRPPLSFFREKLEF